MTERLRYCVDCKHYRNNRCQRPSYTMTALTTAVTKVFGSVDALQERRSYNAYRCGHDGKYWEPEN